MPYAARWTKAVMIAVLAVSAFIHAGRAYAADLPVAAASPLTGVAFDDRPLLLPVQRNFQMAMLTTSSELGRSCGKMEAYGWRMSQVEQTRVNQIFNNTVDRLRLMGYAITPQVLSSVSKDITLFTADNAEKHFLFLWSAGDLGLVLNICQTTGAANTTAQAMDLTPSVQVFPILSNDIVTTDLEAVRSKNIAKFTPVGAWTGSYSCNQGYTGGTLKIGALRGKNFEGEFRFYPTPRNLLIPHGAYTVYGQYDAESHRILINPGKWIERPRNYFYTVMVGNFDPVRDTFSAYFQGINGCTSFEATRHDAAGYASKSPAKHKAAAKKKKRAGKPAPASDAATAPISMDVTPVPVQAVAPAPVSAAVPAAAPPATASPAPVPPAPVAAPAPVQHAPSAMVMPPPAAPAR